MAIKNEQYKQIVRDYDQRQLQNKHELEKRRKEVFAAVPEWKALEDDMISLAAQTGRMAIIGDKSCLAELQAQSIELKARQTELLLSHGFSANYLDMHYQCIHCKDTGYVDKEKCVCFKQAIANLISADSNLNLVLENENFSNFSFSYYSDEYTDETTGLSPLSNMQKIVAYCKSFIRHFKEQHDNLLLLGNTGVGKTFLANCIAKELLDRGNTVIYLTAFRLFDLLEKHKFNKNDTNSYSVANQFDYILSCDLLIIDDLGTELNNSFTNSQLYLILNERLLKQKSTIISTNLSLDNLNTNYSERVYSRILSNYSIRRIIGEDIRLHKAINGNK